MHGGLRVASAYLDHTWPILCQVIFEIQSQVIFENQNLQFPVRLEDFFGGVSLTFQVNFPSEGYMFSMILCNPGFYMDTKNMVLKMHLFVHEEESIMIDKPCGARKKGPEL